MGGLNLPLPPQLSSVPEIDRQAVAWATLFKDQLDRAAAARDRVGSASDASAAVNITANVTAICPVTITLRGKRPVLAVWTAGALANSSGVSQNIQMLLYVNGVVQSPAVSCFGNTPTIATGTTLQLTSPTWLFPKGFAESATTFGMRFSVGDGTASIRYIGNSFSNPGTLSVIEL